MTQFWSWLIRQDHPLLSINVRAFRDWGSWREHWGSASHFEELYGLLHSGFDVPAACDDVIGISRADEANIQAQRICFYLNLADGHALNEDSFMSAEEYNDGDPTSESVWITASLRQRLARKAFALLSQHLFKNNHQAGRLPSWLWVAIHPDVLPKLIWFFRSDEHGKIQNLRSYGSGSSIHLERAHQFALELCRLGWFKPSPRGHVTMPQAAEAESRLVAARPDFIEILLGIEQIGLLENADTYPLDPASWRRMEELALRPRPIRSVEPGKAPVTRPPGSMEEAWANGSAAARVVILRRIRQEDDNRLERLRAEDT